MDFRGVFTYRVVTVPRPTRIRFYRENSCDKPLAAIVRYDFTLNGNPFLFELVYTPAGVGQTRMSLADRRWDFEFRTVEWSTLATGRQLGRGH